ncbi:MAG: phospholipase A [Venatoribacter sp.]
MRYVLFSLFSLLLAQSGHAQEASQEPADDLLKTFNEAKKDADIEGIRTEKLEVEVIAEDELNPQVRYYPRIVKKIQIERLAADSPYVLLPYRPNYVMPFTWQTRPSNAESRAMLENLTGSSAAAERLPNFDHAEVMFQFSLKYNLAKGVLGKFSHIDVAYTNRSFWQAYNSDVSSPFRETNHEPELIFSWLVNHDWLDYFTLTLNHQSNGQSGTMSRSWNRVIASGGWALPYGIMQAKVWARLSEDKKKEPFAAIGDDNPDIEKYLGPGELYYFYPKGSQTFSLMVRNNFRQHNKGAFELGWSFPLSRHIKGYVQYFNGYGESLIDYNRAQQRIGLGFMLSDWL